MACCSNPSQASLPQQAGSESSCTTLHCAGLRHQVTLTAGDHSRRSRTVFRMLLGSAPIAKSSRNAHSCSHAKLTYSGSQETYIGPAHLLALLRDAGVAASTHCDRNGAVKCQVLAHQHILRHLVRDDHVTCGTSSATTGRHARRRTVRRRRSTIACRICLLTHLSCSGTVSMRVDEAFPASYKVGTNHCHTFQCVTNSGDGEFAEA